MKPVSYVYQIISRGLEQVFDNSNSLTALRVPRIPKSPKLAIFMPTIFVLTMKTDTNRLATLPLAHVHGVTVQENGVRSYFLYCPGNHLEVH